MDYRGNPARVLQIFTPSERRLLVHGAPYPIFDTASAKNLTTTVQPGIFQMEYKFALLADAANVSREGKLNITGEFDVINSTGEPPITWPMMCLVARFEGSISEGTEHSARITLVDSDGEIVYDMGDRPFKFVPGGRGLPLRGQIIAAMGVTFPKFDDYEFHILVDGHEKATVPVHVRKIEVPAG